MKGSRLLTTGGAVLLIVAVGIVLLVSACASPAPSSAPAQSVPAKSAAPQKEAQFRWRVQNAFPDSDLSNRVINKGIAKIIEEVTGGQVKVEVFPAGALVAPEEIISAVVDGAVEGGYNMSPAQGDLIPSASCTALAGGPQDINELNELVYGTDLFKRSQEDYRKYGLELVARSFPGEVLLRSRGFRFSNWDAFKGKKGWSSPMDQDVMTDLGAVVVSVPGFDMYSAMKLGTIEWHEWTISELETQGWKEVTTSIVVDPPAFLPTDDFFVNPKAWAALGPELQKKISEGVIPKMVDLGNEYRASDAKALEAAKAYGNELIKFSEADKKKYLQASLKDWERVAATSPECAYSVEKHKELLKKKGRL